MIEAEDGIKIAEDKTEKLIRDALDAADARILQLKLTVELEENAVEFLKHKLETEYPAKE